MEEITTTYFWIIFIKTLKFYFEHCKNLFPMQPYKNGFKAELKKPRRVPSFSNIEQF